MTHDASPPPPESNELDIPSQFISALQAPRMVAAGEEVWADARARIGKRLGRYPTEAGVAGIGIATRQQGLRGRQTRLWGKQTLRRNAAYMVSSLVVAGAVAVIAFDKKGLTGPHSPRSIRTYTTVAGQHAMVTLVDGSRARLGPVTTLAVTTDPAGNRVDARVSGEVLFTVAHRARTTFQVRTENAVTRVLGTTFFVRQYPEDRITQVVVADGRVSLSGTQRSAYSSAPILATRTLGTVDDSGHVLVTPNIVVDDYTAWATDRLVFRDTPMRDVVVELGHAYDIEFRLADSAFAARHLTGTVPLTQRSLTNILDLLSNVLNAHPVRTGRVITFVPGRTSSPRSPDLTSSTPERQYGK